MIYNCKCVVAEKPIEPCSKECWHFFGKENCANCGNTGIQGKKRTKLYKYKNSAAPSNDTPRAAR